MKVEKITRDPAKPKKISDIADQFALSLTPDEFLTLMVIVGSTYGSNKFSGNLYKEMSDLVEYELGVRYAVDTEEYKRKRIELADDGFKVRL
jgi:hypothetical protein